MSIGENVKRLREKKNLSRQDVADKLKRESEEGNLKIKDHYLWLARIETGQRDLKGKHAPALARALGVGIKELMGNS